MLYLYHGTTSVCSIKVLLRKTPEELETHLAAVPDPAYRERQRLSIAHGVAAPHVAQAVRHYDRYVGEMAATLERQPYLAGADYSLADAAATPYVNRAAMLGMEMLWAERRPQVGGWLERMRARPSFDAGITQWLTDADRERFSVPHGETWRKVREILGVA